MKYLRTVLTAALAALFIATVAPAAESRSDDYRRAGWSFGVSSRCEIPTGSGYDNPDWRAPAVRIRADRFEVYRYDSVNVAAAGIGRGVGVEFRAGYAFTERFEVRFVLDMLSNASDSGTVGSASFGADAVYRIPVGRFDLGGYVRYGKHVMTIDGVALDSGSALRDWTFVGTLIGTGVDVRYWLTRRIALSGAAGWSYVRFDRTRSLGNVAITREMEGARDGSVFGISLVAVSVHF